ncbi:Sedoheptulose-bisphosphatase [Gracilaria domingensis]|nr:Sedoheptulose-bisphosphatase [Gracilaria domingensis]
MTDLLEASTAFISSLTPSLNDKLCSFKDPALVSVVNAIAEASTKIAHLLRESTHAADKAASVNPFGDEQLKIDVQADRIIMKALEKCGAVAVGSSEETPVEKKLNENGAYTVAFDPLDGSSIMASNFSVGSIFGVWPGQKLVGVTGRDMAAAIAVVYGPQATMFIAARSFGSYVNHFTLFNGAWRHTRDIYEIKEGKLFAPANLRCAQDNEAYNLLIQYYMKNKYTLRYSGGMVPDVTQILMQRNGVFVSPVSPSAPAKLRLAYEALPMAYLIAAAGGRSSTGESSVLDMRVEECEQRTPVCLGSPGEVLRYEKLVQSTRNGH